jgi:hypothetical protein
VAIGTTRRLKFNTRAFNLTPHHVLDWKSFTSTWACMRKSLWSAMLLFVISANSA